MTEKNKDDYVGEKTTAAKLEQKGTQKGTKQLALKTLVAQLT